MLRDSGSASNPKLPKAIGGSDNNGQAKRAHASLEYCDVIVGPDHDLCVQFQYLSLRCYMLHRPSINAVVANN